MTAVNKRRAIKSAIDRLGMQATPTQIVHALAELGIDVSETHVKQVHFQTVRSEMKAANRRAKPPIKDRRKKRPQQRKTPGQRG